MTVEDLYEIPDDGYRYELIGGLPARRKSRRVIGKIAPTAAACLEDDGLLWVANPKKSSKRYTSDIGRDDSWQALGDHGFEAVRQVAIDEDWSALRFRRVEHIKTLKRDPKRAMTAKGRKRAGARSG